MDTAEANPQGLFQKYFQFLFDALKTIPDRTFSDTFFSSNRDNRPFFKKHLFKKGLLLWK
jgi:hypothetical protein